MALHLGKRFLQPLFSFLSFRKTTGNRRPTGTNARTYMDHEFIGSDTDLRKQLEMISLTDKDLQVLLSLQPIIDKHLDRVTSAFYDKVLHVESLAHLIEQHSTVERLRNTLKDHLRGMFSGRIDQAYVAKRLVIASVHQRIGLQPKWYMGAFQNLQSTIIDVIYESGKEIPYNQLRVIKSVTKMLNFEQQLVLEAYEQANLSDREAQYNKVKAEVKAKIGVISDDLAALTQQTSASVQELIASSIEMNASFDRSVSNSKITSAIANEGQSQLQALGDRMKQIQESTVHMMETVKELGKSSVEITEIVSLVKGIANRTQLLSLNASIEAAHAGIYGQGFAVVAREVKDLSDETKNSVEQISRLISHSRQFSDAVAKSILEVRTLVENGHSESESTSKVFHQIMQSMAANIDEMERVDNEFRGLVKMIEEIGEGSVKVAGSADILNQTTMKL